jgi:nucleoside 2-deoxyribosyltransferase
MSQARHPKRQQVKVFISHSEVDSVFARHVRNLLVQRLNAQVFTTDDLSAAEKWEPKLRNELSAADVVVALLTPNSVESSWVLLEIGAAWALEKPIMPVVSRRDVLNKMPASLEGSPLSLN